MKTTTDIADALLLEAKQVARERGATLHDLVEEGLRLALGQVRAQEKAVPYKFEPLVVGGGMTPWALSKTPHELIYESYGDRLTALDMNLLVYAHRAEMPLHDRARQVLSDVLAGTEAVGIPWPCIHEFIGAVTHRRTWAVAHTMEQTFVAIGRLLNSPQARLLGEGPSPSHFATLRDPATASGIAGAQIHDARIAAICLSHGVRELWSCDRDFGRFPSLRVRNPLVASLIA